MGPTDEGIADKATRHDQNSLKHPVWTPSSHMLSFEVISNTVAANKLDAQPFPIHVSSRNAPRNNSYIHWILKAKKKKNLGILKMISYTDY